MPPGLRPPRHNNIHIHNLADHFLEILLVKNSQIIGASTITFTLTGRETAALSMHTIIIWIRSMAREITLGHLFTYLQHVITELQRILYYGTFPTTETYLTLNRSSCTSHVCYWYNAILTSHKWTPLYTMQYIVSCVPTATPPSNLTTGNGQHVKTPTKL